MCGGEFNISFDVFGATDNLDEFFENKDIYNAVSDTYDPDVVAKPDHTFTVGNDIKPNLLEKASALNFYDELVEHDNNDPLPFEDDRFKTIFGNSIYYINNLEQHLNEVRRVMHPDGKGVFPIFTEHVHSFLKYIRSEWKDELGEDLIETIDRGRSSNHPHLYDDERWTEMFESAGLQVIERKESVTWWHVMMWHIGLRPISPHLIKLAYSAPERQRLQVKKEWIDTWIQLLEPFDHRNFDFGVERPRPELVYVVTPE